MDKIIYLTDTVQSAIKQYCAKGGIGKRIAFDHIRISIDPISSTGIFHLKLQHLDDFLEYILYDKKSMPFVKKEQMVDNYASLHQLSNVEQEVLREYFNLFSKIKEIRTNIERVCSVASKIDYVVGTPDRKKRESKFTELSNLQEGKGYKEQCLALKVLYEKFLKIEVDNLQLFGILNEDIFEHVNHIIRDPMEIYFNTERKDFTFCSPIYGGYYVLNLKIGRNGEAYVSTGYKVRYNMLRNKPEMRRIPIR